MTASGGYVVSIERNTTVSRVQAEQEVTRLASAWTNAELHGDTTVLERLLADDYVGIGPLGFMLTKQEWLARHKTGDLKYQSFTLDEVKVRVYNNDAAILTGLQTQQASYQGNSIPGQFRITLVLVQEGGRWLVASLQLSSIGQAPNFARS
jgi:uncharacterized protein (TIGR02246 family)